MVQFVHLAARLQARKSGMFGSSIVKIFNKSTA